MNRPPSMIHSANDLAALTAADGAQVHLPSAEQRLIIEADPAASMKVTAGAGSGKTTVISQRVVWLVANGHVDPDRILGLTFTRKAVGELGSRIKVLLSRFRHNVGDSGPVRLPGLDEPSVSTYNSYAAAIVAEYGTSIGIEPETVLLDDAAAHALAAGVVDAATSEEIPEDVARETMISDVIALAGAMNDHGRSTEDVVDYLERCLIALVSSKGKPIDLPRRRKLEAKIRTARLAGAYQQAKRRNLAMDFSDQVRFAQDIVDRVPAALAAEQARWSIVLLDEFQDTSVAQLRLLRTLFSGAAVTAVGDPRQAIYGWRGASADNMDRFSADFRNVRSLSLSTSWRNDSTILTVANRIADGLPGESEPPLSARPGAGAGAVGIDVTAGAADPDCITDGLKSLVGWMQSLPDGSSKAVLCRKRSQFAAVATVLEAAGFAVHVHGSSGLLVDPFVADVRAVLTAAVDPLAGSSLMRLLSGRLLGLGAADIAAVSRFTRSRNRSRLDALAAENGQSAENEQAAEAATAQPPGAQVIGESIDQATIVEGIDELIGVSEMLGREGAEGSRKRRPSAEERSALRSFRDSGLSETGLTRVVSLARALRAVRSATGSIASIIRTAMVRTGLDSDIWGLGDSLRNFHRTSVDALLSAAGQYSASVDVPTLAGFLDWLAVMEAKDSLGGAEPSGGAGAIDIMTVHASKGLEFDAVAVPSLVVRDFPTLPRDKEGWMDRTALPYPLRGDRAHLVDFDLSTVQVETAKELKEWIGDFIRPAVEDAHAAEERRLAYVAFTRARHHLWLGAELMGSRSTPDELSPFLTEAVSALEIELDLPEPAEAAAGSVLEDTTWPLDRTEAVATARRAAGWVASAPETELSDLAGHDGWVGRFARRAIQARRQRASPGGETIPDRLSATSLVSWRRDPTGYLTQVLRPVPEPPSTAALIGTSFHSWVEAHFGQASIDVDEDEAVRFVDAERLAALQETFLASDFATRSPTHVEMSFELVLGRFRVPGKIDAVFVEGTRAEVIDWKTSRRPDDATLEVMKWQLALYRFAVQRAHPEVTEVTGTFYFVGSDDIVSFRELPSEEEIIDWLGAHGSAGTRS